MKAGNTAFGLIVATALLLINGYLHADPVAKPFSSDLNSNALQKKDKPNIILIVADDLGFADIGAFGGEIATPNLDSLAAEGLKLTNFHTQASCSPTRSMLLTGVDNHLNGMGTMSEDLMPHHAGLPGYVGYLNSKVTTIASVLKGAGYHTYMAGKWHLGFEPEQRPHARGFESTFALLNGTANHYSDGGPNAKAPKASYTINGEPTVRPEGYSSDLFTSELDARIRKGAVDGAPFFAYLAFTAPHWPLQAPQKTIEKYRGNYDAGWDQIRLNRFEKMKKLGLVPAATTLPERIAELPTWQSLSQQEREIEARKMEVYAAMVETVDNNVGRLMTSLKAQGLYENSVIIFMSDNGADPYDRSERSIYKDWIAQNFDNSIANIGRGDSYTFQGLGWSQASSVLYKYHKFLPGEGGTRSPVIIRYPGVNNGGEVKTQFASILDIAPTMMSIAGVDANRVYRENNHWHRPKGRSMLPYLTGQKNHIYGVDEAVSFELFGHRTVYMGPWKAVRVRPPWGENSWALYNLESDPAEQNNLRQERKDILTQMVQAYKSYEKDNQVIDEVGKATAYPNKPTYLKPLMKTEVALDY